MGNQNGNVVSAIGGSEAELYKPATPKTSHNSKPAARAAAAVCCVRQRRGSSTSLRRTTSLKKSRSIRRNSRAGYRPYKYKAKRNTRRAEAEMERKIAEEERRLFEAAARGDTEEVEVLVDSGVDVNATDANQMTALHHAAMHARDQAIKALLERGADPNASDLKGGFSPLHWVVINADPQICSVDHVDASLVALARGGCNVNCTDFNFATPLHIAAQKGSKVCVDTLIRLGANPELTDITGRDCFQIAKSDEMKESIEKLYRMKKEVIYHVLEVPPSTSQSYRPPLPAPRRKYPLPPLPPLPSLPLPPPPPPPPHRLLTKPEAIYHVLESSPSELPPPPPPHRNRKSTEVIYHVLEVSPSPESPPPTPPRRRKARYV